ncbi:MAG: PAS domain-containing protein [candidate division WOR-3 bacterium]
MGNHVATPPVNKPRRIEFDLDLEGRITAVSPLVESTTGFKAEELIGMPLIALVHHEDLHSLQDRWRLALTGEVSSYVIRLAGKYGDFRRVRTSTRPRFDNGHAVGLTQIMTEIRRPSRN